MNGGFSSCKGIVLYNTKKQGENAVYGYYEEDKIVVKKGNLEELREVQRKEEKPFKPKDKLNNKLFVILAVITLISIVVAFALTSFFKGLFLSAIFVAAFMPILGLIYANISLYELKDDSEQFKRYHGCEHACINMLSKEKEPTMENLKSLDIYDSECGTVYMGYILTVLFVAMVIVLNFGAIGFIKSIGILLATVIVLLVNVFNPYNPYKILQKNVVSKPTEREYTLGLELIKTLKEL